MNKCSPNGLGVAIGGLWAIYVFIGALLAISGWGTEMVKVLGSFYIGYNATFIGAIIGAIWAFIDGYVGGFVIALIYNKVAK